MVLHVFTPSVFECSKLYTAYTVRNRKGSPEFNSSPFLQTRAPFCCYMKSELVLCKHEKKTTETNEKKKEDICGKEAARFQ